MTKQHLFLLSLLLILMLKIYLQGGLEKPTEDPYIDQLTSIFIPMRNSLSELVSNTLPSPQSALLSGMVLGVKSDLPSEFKQALINTSTIHIVVVSGQNLSLLAGFIMTFSFLIGRKKTLIISLTVVVLYAILTGLQIPVLRAAIMVVLATISQLFGRTSQTPIILLITALSMLIYQPNWLLSISFQLSFLATVAVTLVAPVIIARLSFFPEIIKQDFGVSIAAQLLTWPIIAINFHQLSLLGVFTNTFILFTIPIIMITGPISILGSLINPDLGWLISQIPLIFLNYFVYIVELFNQSALSTIYIQNYHPAVWIGYYLCLLAIYLKLIPTIPKPESDSFL